MAMEVNIEVIASKLVPGEKFISAKFRGYSLVTIQFIKLSCNSIKNYKKYSFHFLA